MKTFIIIFVFLSLASCGRDSAKSEQKEVRYLDELVDSNVVSEKELLRRLLLIDDLSESLLVNLDQEIKVTCFNGMCELYRKDGL